MVYVSVVKAGIGFKRNWLLNEKLGGVLTIL